jgi:hypothetical protein
MNAAASYGSARRAGGDGDWFSDQARRRSSTRQPTRTSDGPYRRNPSQPERTRFRQVPGRSCLPRPPDLRGPFCRRRSPDADGPDRSGGRVHRRSGERSMPIARCACFTIQLSKTTPRRLPNGRRKLGGLMHSGPTRSDATPGTRWAHAEPKRWVRSGFASTAKMDVKHDCSTPCGDPRACEEFPAPRPVRRIVRRPAVWTGLDGTARGDVPPFRSKETGGDQPGACVRFHGMVGLAGVERIGRKSPTSSRADHRPPVAAAQREPGQGGPKRRGDPAR